ncbi:hypothetical protein M0R72_16945 [Candidatus Pacearchaeota archaeon]|jgi:hypothetical protein|nr:hypothetical protein [Candidatus Pacearchaeota archaeon]
MERGARQLQLLAAIEAATDAIETSSAAIKTASETMSSNVITLAQDTALLDLGATDAVRITNDATSQSVTVPVDAIAFVCIAEEGDCRLEIDSDASSTSTLLVPDGGMIVYPIAGGTQTLACYGVVSSYGNFRFMKSAH